MARLAKNTESYWTRGKAKNDTGTETFHIMNRLSLALCLITDPLSRPIGVSYRLWLLGLGLSPHLPLIPCRSTT